MNRKAIVKELERELKHEDYETDYFAEYGLRKVFIGKGTLGPEMSWVSHILARHLLQHPELFKGKKVLDMGCGSGIQAIIAALNCASFVLAADISPYAVRSTRENAKRFNLKKVKCIRSDLFKKVKIRNFDVIIFNHPFLAGKPKNAIQAIYLAQKKAILKFFQDARNFLAPQGIIIMPFSHFGDYPPEKYAKEFGYCIAKETKLKNKFGKQSIYTMAPAKNCENL